MEKDIRYRNIKREPLRVRMVLTDGTRVEGMLYLISGNRLIDQLNAHFKENPFIALTDAKVHLPDGKWTNYEFFSVNLQMVTCCFPVEDS
jgi:hypothetical protein